MHFNKIAFFLLLNIIGLSTASLPIFNDYWVPTVKYNLGDTITARVILDSIPCNVTTYLQNTNGEMVYGEENEFTRKLSKSDDGDGLIVVFYTADKSIKMKPIIRYQLIDQTLNGEQRHICLDHCDIVLDDWV